MQSVASVILIITFVLTNIKTEPIMNNRLKPERFMQTFA